MQPAGRPFFGFLLLLDLNWGMGREAIPLLSVWVRSPGRNCRALWNLERRSQKSRTTF